MVEYNGELDEVRPGDIGEINEPAAMESDHSVLSMTLFFGTPIALIFALIAYNGIFG